MDTRQAIQSTLSSAVLDIAFNEDCSRFICGLADGLRAFRSRDCARTLSESPSATSVLLASQLDDRHFAIVCTGHGTNHAQNKVQLWDNVTFERKIELDFAEPVLGVHVCTKTLSVVLLDRVVCFEYLCPSEDGLRTPTNPTIHPTCSNPHAIFSARGDRMAIPALSPGQVQLVRHSQKSRNIIRAHASELRQLDVSSNSELVATASKHGTLIRVFSTTTLAQTHEFRRGVDEAIIFSLAISPADQFVATTSDKGTLHVFDLRPSSKDASRRKTPNSRPFAATAYPRSGPDFDALSLISSPSPPRFVGGFHEPPVDTVHTPPANGPSALSALAKMPGMPRALSDARSMTSAPFYLGDEKSSWQGLSSWLHANLPSEDRDGAGSRGASLPGKPDGRPPKGVLAWDPESGDRRLWCVGGGSDARWEVFELAGTANDIKKLKLIRVGFQNYAKK